MLNGANVRRTRSQQTVPKEANYSMKEKKKKKKKGGGGVEHTDTTDACCF